VVAFSSGHAAFSMRLSTNGMPAKVKISLATARKVREREEGGGRKE
jgi:hypothetical protein